MVFSSPVFMFLFLPFVLALYYAPIVRGRGVRNALLCAASLGFYAWGEPLFVVLLCLSIALTWGVGIAIDRSRDPRVGVSHS